MNHYITELSSLIPMSNADAYKLDKISVIKMAVQYLKSIRVSLTQFSEENLKYSFTRDLELKNLMEQVRKL